MVSRKLEEASAKLDKAHKDLLKVQHEARLKGPRNEYARVGFSKYTTFAMNCRLRFQKSQASLLPKSFSFSSLPFPEFSSGAQGSGESSTFLDEIQLWSGKRGDYLSMSKTIIKQFKKALALSTNTVKIELNITPKELLLVQICAKLNSQANNNLILFREHYRYPNEKTSVVHFITMFPLKFLLTPRDFLVLMTHHQEKNGTIYFVIQSLRDLLPESKGCVRGFQKLTGMKIEPVEDGCRVEYLFDVDVSIWLPRVSFNEYMIEEGTKYLKFCEATILQLRQTPGRLKRLKNEYLKHLKSVDFRIEEDNEEEEDEESEDEVAKLRKLQKKIDDEIALYSSEDEDEYSEEEHQGDTTDASDYESESDSSSSVDSDILSLSDSDDSSSIASN